MTVPAIVTVSRDFAAPPERVFDAWLDPDQARHFLFATPDGEMTTCDIDPRVGGAGLIVERRAEGEARHRLRFEVIDRPRRLVFQFAGPGSDWTRVEIAIAATDSGCRLTLAHKLDPEWTDFADRTRHGWDTILGGLAKVVEAA